MADESKRLEGEILNVMETFPLQLEVRVEERKVHVKLKEETEVRHRESRVDASVLTPRSHIAVKGMPRGEGIEADTIEVFEFGPVSTREEGGGVAPAAAGKKKLEIPEGTILGAPPMTSEISGPPRKPKSE